KNMKYSRFMKKLYKTSLQNNYNIFVNKNIIIQAFQGKDVFRFQKLQSTIEFLIIEFALNLTI
ncbi:hypothetical protein C2G38_2121552, partial [Gigaspora rosea]